MYGCDDELAMNAIMAYYPNNFADVQLYSGLYERQRYYGRRALEFLRVGDYNLHDRRGRRVFSINSRGDDVSGVYCSTLYCCCCLDEGVAVRRHCYRSERDLVRLA